MALEPATKSRVIVLMGGASSEREISLSTGKMILEGLDTARYEARGMDVDAFLEHIAHWTRQPVGNESQSGRPDVVFIALHGRGGEDGAIQGLLETLKIPYTGSGILASALAMDKAMSKQLFRSSGIPVIPEVLVNAEEMAHGKAWIGQIQEALGFPVFVKPNAEGSSCGGGLAQDPDALCAALRTALRFDTVAMVEQYIRGVEITVSVLEEADRDVPVALPVIEIVPNSEFYDYESKYVVGGSLHIIPARLRADEILRAQEIALHCHRILGCRGMSRTDLIVTEQAMFVLEVNTIPGMTPTSLLPQAAEHAGISFPRLLDRLIACGIRRAHAR